MKYFVLVGGIPGSGKSYLAKLLQQRHGGYLIDDPKDIDSELDKIPDDENLIFITDPFFCLRNVQTLAEEKLYVRFPHCGTTWIFLENNPDQCRLNVAERDDGRQVEGSIRRFSREFHLPPYAYVVPCYRYEAEFVEEMEKINI